MIDFSFVEKLAQLKDIIMSSPLFFVFIIVGIILLIVMLLGVRKNRRINKIIFIIAWFFVVTFVVIKYHSALFYILDRLFGRIVEEIYFPSFSIYTVMLLITNVLFVHAIVSKKIKNMFRILNVTLGMEINFLFVMVLDTIVRNDIDIYTNLIVYSNSKLLVLLEFSMIVFVLWLLLLGIFFLINKYAVKKVYVDLYKDEDYEILDTDNDLEENNEAIILEKESKIFLNEDLEVIDI